MSTPAATNPEHIRFLVSCIRHANNGKVDFDAVRLELDIVTKAAAAKRYERLLKAYPAKGGGGDAEGAVKKRKAPAAANGEAKRPKAGGKKASPKAKREDVKEEDTSSDSCESAAADVKAEDEAEAFEA